MPTSKKKLSCSCNAVGYSFVDFSLLPSMQLRDQAPLRTRQHSHAKAKIDSVLSIVFYPPVLTSPAYKLASHLLSTLSVQLLLYLTSLDRHEPILVEWILTYYVQVNA